MDKPFSSSYCFLPDAEELTFNFSMGLPDRSCSLDGLFFKVLLNGEKKFEHFAFNTPGWIDAQVFLSEFAGETVLLELVTDSVESATCDWAHWADLLITAEGDEPKRNFLIQLHLWKTYQHSNYIADR